MDGVLIHSAEAHGQAFHTVFESLGIDDFEYSSYAGWRTPEVIRDVLKRRGLAHPSSIVEDASRNKTRLARQMLDAEYPMDTNAGRVIGHLAAEYRLGLATSGSRGSVDSFLSH